MGYRSDGRVFLSEKAQEILTDDLREDLESEWEKSDSVENEWYFSCWKWYPSYEIVGKWEDFFRQLQEDEIAFDFIRIGEELEDVEILTGERFYCERNIGWY